MIPRVTLVLVFILFVMAGCVSTAVQQQVSPGQHEESFERVVQTTISGRYLAFLPEGYGETEKEWPLMLFLHGAGERGDSLALVKKHGPPKIAEQEQDFPFIVISPQCPANEWWDTTYLKGLLDEVVASYNVDKDRIYLTGLSMGGFGSWAFASEFPDLFAAVVPICGGGDVRMARRLRAVPIWAFHGAKDEVVPLERSEQMVEAIKHLGGDVRLTVYPEAGHDSWTETYDNPALYEWLLQHRLSDRKN